MLPESKHSKKRTLLLGASDTIATVPSVPLERGGSLSFQVIIDNGTDDVAPTDTPAGTWQLWASSGDGVYFSRLTSTAVDAELAKLNPNGNAVVTAFAIFTNVPGTAVRLLYVATSGGATSRARIYAVVG